MFIAIVSTMAFLGLAGKLLNEQRDNFSHLQKYSQSNTQHTIQSLNQNQSGVGAISVLFCLLIFSLQDLVHKWRNAHRRHPLNKEMNDIMDRLQYSLL
jgi:RNase adaptor protein for sRNA GlmZ degradation